MLVLYGENSGLLFRPTVKPELMGLRRGLMRFADEDSRPPSWVAWPDAKDEWGEDSWQVPTRGRGRLWACLLDF